MAADAKGKDKDKDKKEKKAASPAAGKDKSKTGGAPSTKAAKPKKEKAGAEAEAPAESPKAAPPKPKTPADPRRKYIKKFESRFLPRGPLRDRHKAILSRWNSDEDHGGVTLEELKSLLEDWRAARAKPRRSVRA